MAIIAIASMYLISNRITVHIFQRIGSISYSIYLFHKIFFLLVNKFSGYGKNSLVELCLILLFFPVFVYACSKLEFCGNYVASFLKNLPNKALHWTGIPLLLTESKPINKNNSD
jgi:peptidoglycan/LPS O-acetylase OafA/YrhL